MISASVIWLRLYICYIVTLRFWSPYLIPLLLRISSINSLESLGIDEGTLVSGFPKPLLDVNAYKVASVVLSLT